MKFIWLLFTGLLVSSNSVSAEALAPSELLPSETIFMATVPNAARLRETTVGSPYVRLWNDPAMRPFKEKIVSQIQSSWIEPLEAKLGIELDTYKGLAQGQVTLAVLLSKDAPASPSNLAWVLLMDAGDQQERLTQLLSELKKKWTDSGKKSQTQTIHGFDFTTISLKAAVPASTPDANNNNQKSGGPETISLTVGQADSLLLVGNDIPSLEKIVIRQSGGLIETLMDLPSFESNYHALFREAVSFAWLNTDRVREMILARSSDSQPSLVPWPTLFEATGLSGLKSIAMAARADDQGSLVDLAFNIPESRRKGLFHLFATQDRETAPPSFVPANVTKFTRWRLDGQQAWAAIEKMIAEISPLMGRHLQESLNILGKDRNPDFDFRRVFIANLGTDFISYEKVPTEPSLLSLSAPPSLLLIGSPNPPQLALGLQALTSIIPGPGGKATVEEDEFLGRTVHTVLFGLPSRDMKTGEVVVPANYLYFAASGGYLALSSDRPMLEEYLRGNPPEVLRQNSAIPGAAEHVDGMNTGLFGYKNHRQTMETTWKVLDDTKEILPQLLRLGPLGNWAQSRNLEDWLPLSSLPPFEAVAKYFYFTVYSGQVNQNGLLLKFYTPTPPNLE